MIQLIWDVCMDSKPCNSSQYKHINSDWPNNNIKQNAANVVSILGCACVRTRSQTKYISIYHGLGIL